MRWPWTSRARLDDALVIIAEQRTKICALELENRHLVNQIFVRHGVRPVYPETEGTASAASVPAVCASPAFDPLQQEAPTVVREAVKNGARSAREICAGVERIFDRQHREATGQLRRREPVAPIAPPAQAAVAAELAAIMKGNGTH